jgi:uncharacterized phage protein (TIGR02218 family)
MPEARVDQAGVYALAEVLAEARVDQVGAYALVSIGAEARVAQSGVYALVGITADVNIAQAGAYVLGSGAPCGMRWAQIWTITRTDGQIFRFTSLDRDLEYGGNTFQACDSLVPSASQAVSEVDASGTMDLSGAIGPDGITEHDLYSGLFDGAEVEAWLVPWGGAETPRLLLKGTFGEVEQSQTGFKLVLQGDGAKLMQTPLVRTLQPGCRWKFGDPSTCAYDLASVTVTGTVDTGQGQRAFTDAARAEAAGYFSRGVITFTGGLNDGISAEIKEHSAGGVFQLWPRLPYAVMAGDTYSMSPGCTNLEDSSGGTNGCTAWANLVNYGGFPDVPTKDKLTAAAVDKNGA